jgi:hypothetical protein
MATQNANAVAITGGTVAATFTGNLTGNTAGVHTGAVTGNVTGNVTGSSGSCTGNAATATTATNVTNAIGQGQTWQNVAGSRANGTTYTNSTGKPIMVSLTVIGTGTITVDGVVAAMSGVNNAVNNLGAIIPNGSSYIVAGYTMYWAELR